MVTCFQSPDYTSCFKLEITCNLVSRAMSRSAPKPGKRPWERGWLTCVACCAVYMTVHSRAVSILNLSSRSTGSPSYALTKKRCLKNNLLTSFYPLTLSDVVSPLFKMNPVLESDARKPVHLYSYCSCKKFSFNISSIMCFNFSSARL